MACLRNLRPVRLLMLCAVVLGCNSADEPEPDARCIFKADPEQREDNLEDGIFPWCEADAFTNPAPDGYEISLACLFRPEDGTCEVCGEGVQSQVRDAARQKPECKGRADEEIFIGCLTANSQTDPDRSCCYYVGCLE